MNTTDFSLEANNYVYFLTINHYRPGAMRSLRSHGSMDMGVNIMIPPISIDGDFFEEMETFNNGYDISLVLRNGDTLNVYIDKQGQTHVTMQHMNVVKPELYEY